MLIIPLCYTLYFGWAWKLLLLFVCGFLCCILSAYCLFFKWNYSVILLQSLNVWLNTLAILNCPHTFRFFGLQNHSPLTLSPQKPTKKIPKVNHFLMSEINNPVTAGSYLQQILQDTTKCYKTRLNYHSPCAGIDHHFNRFRDAWGYIRRYLSYHPWQCLQTVVYSDR